MECRSEADTAEARDPRPLHRVECRRRPRNPGWLRPGQRVIVVDATIWVDLLRGTLPSGYSDRIAIAGCVSAPNVDFEVGSALIRLERRGDLEPGQAEALITAFSAHPVDRVREPVDAVEAIRILDNATYADAWYIAIAKRREFPLMTLDDGMKEAARIHGVELVGPPNPEPDQPA
ncbi:type II toxin-antitoxin system VapC family toxin [Nocardia sp. FBN12]|uniref:type II toxin-antitoxin system VapC family toxin n=1 Tax=Nocardia sp. FBN12 TaxID=3419766 RepID=UPI003D02446A